MFISKKIGSYLPLPDEEIREVRGRATGKTTGLAFRFISAAILNPLETIEVKDHYPSMLATRLLYRQIKDICYKMGLDWMEFPEGTFKMRYNPYIEIKSQVIWDKK